MDKIDIFPEDEITNKGPFSAQMLEYGVNNFRDAAYYIRNLEYGYNSDKDDPMILFKEKKGSCTTKHSTFANLALELSIPVFKKIGVYKFTDEIVSGTYKILAKYNLSYVPMTHCFLSYDDYRVDLTEGNYNGKNCSIEEFIYIEKVNPDFTQKEEYMLLRNCIEREVLNKPEMKRVDLKTLLKAREECVKLLKNKIL